MIITIIKESDKYYFYDLNWSPVFTLFFTNIYTLQ